MKFLFSRIALLVITIENSLVAGAILYSPSEAASARLWGLSTARLVLFGSAVFFALISLGLLIFSYWQRVQFGQRESVFRRIFAQRKPIAIATILLTVFVWAASELAIYAGVAQEPVMQAVLMGLRPLLIGGALMASELLIVIWVWHWGENDIRPWKNKDAVSILILWAAFLLVGLFQFVKGYGFAEESAERGVFRSLGTPILGFQILFALSVVLVGGMWLWPKIRNARIIMFLQARNLTLNFLLGLLIWGIAFGAWMAAPLKQSWFVDPPRPANYTFSPNSDAYLYETVGQSLLAGAGFWHPQWGAMVLRPMYSGILALFHWVAGLGYEEIIWLQVALLALFPTLVFQLTSTLHQRRSGFLAALLIIFREYNAITLADTITVSHAKLLMADLPATLGTVLVVLLFVRWLQSPEKRIFPLLAGGAIGFFLLIRMESWALFSLLIFAAIYLVPRNAGKMFQGAGLVVIGFGLLIAPWMWRNWQVTKMVYIISPDYEQKIIDKISRVVPLDITILEAVKATPEIQSDSGTNGVSEPPVAITIPDTDQGAAVTSVPIPASDASWSGSEKFLHHFFNNQLQALMYFPLSPRLLISATALGITRRVSNAALICCSPEAYVRALPFWWSGWDGKLAPESLISMGAILFLTAIGLIALWRDQKFLGLVPIFFGMAYFSLLAALGRSGGRWILEVDWISAIIYSVGMVELLDWITQWAAQKKYRSPRPKAVEDFSAKPGKTYLVFVLILLVGLVLPLSETLIPRQYTPTEMNTRLNRIISNEDKVFSQNDIERMEDLLSRPDSDVWYGRALYPRFFEADDGMIGLGGTYIRPFPRMEFYLVGTENNFSYMPHREAVQIDHAADVLLIGRRGVASSYFDIVAVIPFTEDGITPRTIFWSDISLEE